MRAAIVSITLAFGISAGQDARSVLDQAVKTMGNPKTIQFSGTGALFTLGQNVNPAAPWPRVELKSFTRAVDYGAQSARNDAVGPQGPAPSQFVSGDRAWGQSAAGVITPAPNIAAERQLQIWLTPHGFLKGALAGNATARSRKSSGRKVTEVSFNHGKHRIVGAISENNLVEKVETWLDNPVLGSMHVETAYSGYRDFGGVKFPARIVQKQGGFPVLDLTVTEARPEAAVSISVPDAARPAAPPAVKVASEKLSDGVWYLTGGSHHSVAVEFRDHVAVIEAPQNEERSRAVMAEVARLIPNKPLRYLVNTHHHFDHSGGLRAYVAERVPVVTHRINAPFYQRIMKGGRKPKLISVDARHVLTDGARTVEIHHIQGNPHNDGILMAYLPREKILVEVDVYSPPPPNAPPPASPNPATVNLYDNIARLKLDVDRIAALHGRVATLADLRKAAGK